MIINKKIIDLFNSNLTNKKALYHSYFPSKMQRRIKNERPFLIFIGKDSFSLLITFNALTT